MDRGNNDDADRDQNLQGKRIDDATSKKISTTTLKGKTEEFNHQDPKTQRHKLTLTNFSIGVLVALCLGGYVFFTSQILHTIYDSTG